MAFSLIMLFQLFNIIIVPLTGAALIWRYAFQKLRFGMTGDEFLVLYISGQYILELQELRPLNVYEQKTNYTKEWSEKRQIYGK